MDGGSLNATSRNGREGRHLLGEFFISLTSIPVMMGMGGRRARKEDGVWRDDGTHGVSPTTRETADARVWSQRVTTRQDRHNNLCHQPPPRKDRASLRRRRRTRISTFRAKFTRPRVIPRSLIACLAYTIEHYVPSLLTRRARVLHNWRRSRYHPIFSACSLLT